MRGRTRHYHHPEQLRQKAEFLSLHGIAIALCMSVHIMMHEWSCDVPGKMIALFKPEKECFQRGPQESKLEGGLGGGHLVKA